MAVSKGRNVPRNRKEPTIRQFRRELEMPSDRFLPDSPSPAGMGPGISPSRQEPDYPTSAPSFSKRPQARPEPVRPRARPARIEQEAAEAAAVEGGNNEARRRASDPQNFRDGGSVRGCKSVQSSGTGFSGSY